MVGKRPLAFFATGCSTVIRNAGIRRERQFRAKGPAAQFVLDNEKASRRGSAPAAAV